MTATDSPLSLGIFGTSLIAASLLLSAMCDTNSSLLDNVGTPFKAASFQFSTMRDTNPSLFGLIGTSLKAALFHLRSMCDTNPSVHSLLSTSPVTASFVFCAVSDAHSARNGLIGTPHRPAFCFTSSFIRCNRRPTVAFHLRRLLLHLRLRLLLDDDAFVDNSSTSTGRHDR